MARKPVVWMGSARQDLRAFPRPARRRAGHELDLVQEGIDPADFRPMGVIGPGTYELRVRAQGAFRVFYVAKFEEAVYVLHAFQKKTQKTASLDLATGQKRYRDVLARRQHHQGGV